MEAMEAQLQPPLCVTGCATLGKHSSQLIRL